MNRRVFLAFLLAAALFAAPALALEEETVVLDVAAVPGHVSLIESLPDFASLPQYSLTFGDGKFSCTFEPGAFTYISLEAKANGESLTAYDEDGDGVISGALPGGAKDRSELSSVGLRSQQEDHYVHVTPRKNGETETVMMKFHGDAYEIFIWTNGVVDSWGYSIARHPVTGRECDLNVYYNEEGALETYYCRIKTEYAYFDANNALSRYSGLSGFFLIKDGIWSKEGKDALNGIPEGADARLCVPIPIAVPETESTVAEQQEQG